MQFFSIPGRSVHDGEVGGLRVLAPAKINLHLEVGPRRDDGLHEIDSLIQAVSLYDELEFRWSESPEIELEESGISASEDNLVWRAAAALRRSAAGFAGARRGVRIRLTKRIPQGAGLGGGSSDAAATLLALARMWGLDDSARALAPLAAELGSDVPFFLWGGVARCRGSGTRVDPISPPPALLGRLRYVLVYPRINIITKMAYEELDRSRDPNFTLTHPAPLDSILSAPECGDLSREAFFDGLFFNRFEPAVYPLFPELKSLHERLEREPFERVLMSGSGSTIFGVCDGAQANAVGGRLARELDADVFVVQGLATRAERS